MGRWTRPARIALISFVVTFALAVFLGMQQRRSPTRAVAVDRADEAAIIQSRGSRIVLAGGSVIEADEQFAYEDGSVRLVGVTVTVPERSETTSFGMQGDEASGVEETGEWRFAGNVRIETGDGLHGSTSDAAYTEVAATVTMPQPAEFEQGWMRLAGDAARYNLRRSLLRLAPRAVVSLTTTGAGAETRITAASARIARLDGYMRFNGRVQIDSAGWRMQSNTAVVNFDPDASRLDALDLRGAARIRGTTDRPGRLREMSAGAISVGYDDGAIDQATLTGRATVELFGLADSVGTRVAGRTVSVALGDNGGLRGLDAVDRVTVDLPALDSSNGDSRIAADAVEIAAGEENRWDAAFAGQVEYRERHGSDERDTRIIRANRLEAALAEDLASLETARFLGGVAVDDGSLAATAHEASYDVGNARLTLSPPEDGGAAPRVDDLRGTTEAETITLLLDGPGIEATGQVKSVLEATEGEHDEDSRRPGLLASNERIYVAADHFVYDSELSVATYSATPPATARLWQDQADFVGASITMNEATGSLHAEGDVRTRTTIVQKNDETGAVEALTTIGRGESMAYDDATRRVVYTTDAFLENPRNDLSAQTIEIHLQDDARTLDRILSSDGVELQLPGRRVTGETMAYDDIDGRYEMEGDPVAIVERSADSCRETTGRSLTFFITDEVQIDGEGEGRTSSSNDQCTGLPPGP